MLNWPKGRTFMTLIPRRINLTYSRCEAIKPLLGRNNPDNCTNVHAKELKWIYTHIKIQERLTLVRCLRAKLANVPHTHKHSHKHIEICTNTHGHIYTRGHTHKHAQQTQGTRELAHTHTRMCARTHTYTDVNVMRTRALTQVHTCMWVYTCVHGLLYTIHTWVHITCSCTHVVSCPSKGQTSYLGGWCRLTVVSTGNLILSRTESHSHTNGRALAEFNSAPFRAKRHLCVSSAPISFSFSRTASRKREQLRASGNIHSVWMNTVPGEELLTPPGPNKVETARGCYRHHCKPENTAES